MPSRPTKEFLATFIQVLDQIYSTISDDQCDPPAKRQKIEKETKHSITQKKVRFLQKKRILAVGLLETQKLLVATSIIFIMNDPEHSEINRQLMIACKQMGISHFVLPKFAKNELQLAFGVKRLTTFGLNFSGMEHCRDKLTEKVAEFNNNFEAKPDLNKYRYADDSMFN